MSCWGGWGREVRDGGGACCRSVVVATRRAISQPANPTLNHPPPTHTHCGRGISGMCRSLLLIHLHVSLSLHPFLIGRTPSFPPETAAHIAHPNPFSTRWGRRREVGRLFFLEIFSLIALEPRVASNPLAMAYVAC